MYDFFFTFILKLTLLNVQFDILILQLSIFSVLYFAFSVTNIYMFLLYFFLFCIYLGLTISLLQMELFTGFLWVTEFTVIFVLLLLLFYLNTDGYINLKQISKIFLFFSFFFCFFLSFSESEFHFIFNFTDLWHDYYETFSNTLMTDFFGLFLVYYYYNGFLTCLIGFYLFVVTIACVLMLNLIKVQKIGLIHSYLQVFDFFKQSINYFFYRRQNLHKQTMKLSSTKIFKKNK